MVEIIPKPPEKTPFWQNLIFFLTIAILVIAILAYFVLKSLQTEALEKIKKLDQEIAKTETKERMDLKADLFLKKRKVDDFVLILDKHRASSNFFNFLESVTHPKVWFTEVKLDVLKSTVELSGEADKLAFGQQLLVFQKNEKIFEISLSQISIGKEPEKVEFTLSLSFDSEILK